MSNPVPLAGGLIHRFGRQGAEAGDFVAEGGDADAGEQVDRQQDAQAFGGEDAGIGLRRAGAQGHKAGLQRAASQALDQFTNWALAS